MASRAGTGERYATQVGALWTGLAHTLTRLEAIAAEPERLEDEKQVEVLRRLQYGLHTRERARLRPLAARRHRARAHRARGRARRRARRDRRASSRPSTSGAPRQPSRSSGNGAARSSACGSRGCGSSGSPPLGPRAEPDAPLSLARAAHRAGADRRRLGDVRRRRPDRAVAGLGRRDDRGLQLRCSRSAASRRRAAARATRRGRAARGSRRAPGETFEPVTARRIGANAWRGFWPRPSASARSASSIAGVVPRLDRGERVGGGAARLGVGAVGRDRLEEEAHVVGVLRELLELLLHERHRRAHRLLRPVDALLARASASSAAAYSSSGSARRWTPFIQSSFS